MFYASGEEIRPGDRIAYAGNVGTIELVVEGLSNDPQKDWLFENHGAGVMVHEPTLFGRVYLPSPHDDKDLEFIGRSE